MSGNTPGNGRTSPFGNGDGTGDSPMAGVDLIKDPKGMASAGRAKGGDPLNPSKTTPDKKAPAPASVVAGGNTAAEVYSPGQARGGVGSVGNSQKPYKLGGA